MRTLTHNRFLILTGAVLVCLLGTCPVLAEVDLQIYSDPSGAQVSVDNFWYDVTPATITGTGCGWHTIVVTMEGYQPAFQSQYCDDNDGGIQTCVINVDLDPVPAAYGWLDIAPSGAEVFVDGIDEGNGDMTIPLAPGDHTLTLRNPGYYDATETFTITAGKTTSRSPGMTPYPEQPEYGSLQIESDPAGASVFLDNAYKGIEPADGPFYITDLKPGTYTLTLMMPDYQTWTEKVEVQAGIVNDLWPRLAPATPGQSPDTTGQVFAYSTPGGANVFLDNAFVGITPVTLRDIAEGSHTVTFRLPGYPDYSTTADVTGGQVVNVPAAFTRQAGSPAATAPRPTQAPVCGITALVGIAAALIYRSRNR